MLLQTMVAVNYQTVTTTFDVECHIVSKQLYRHNKAIYKLRYEAHFHKSLELYI